MEHEDFYLDLYVSQIAKYRSAAQAAQNKGRAGRANQLTDLANTMEARLNELKEQEK